MTTIQPMTQEAITKMALYREAAIGASLSGHSILAFRWRLAADAAKNFVRQTTPNKILTPQNIPFADTLANLMRATQKANHYLVPSLLSAQKKNQKITSLWFLATDETEEAAENYWYWVTRAAAETSTALEKEKSQATEAAAKYLLDIPKAAYYAHMAAEKFDLSQTISLSVETPNLLEHEILQHRWRTVAYEASHVASIIIHAAKATSWNDEMLQQLWKEIVCLAEHALLLRTQAAVATQEGHETVALQYSLAAYLAGNAADYKIKLLELLPLGNNEAACCWNTAATLAEKAAAERVKTFESTASRTAVAFWLENAFDYRTKALESLSQENQSEAHDWTDVAQAAEATADLWAQVETPSEQCSSIFQKGYLLTSRKKARRAERKTKEKLLQTMMKKVSFYVPELHWPDAAARHAWQEGKMIPRTEYATPHIWLYQTWSLLQAAGVNCTISTQLPKQGIVITLGHWYLPACFGMKTPSDSHLFFVDVVADTTLHPAAPLHLLQNKKQVQQTPHSFFVPHWPQPHLISRNPARGNRFENVCFFGVPLTLAPELSSQKWQERLQRELGLHFQLRNKDRWHDYSDVDCVLAVRDFSTSPHLSKPATKLYNAWHAGVPFIGGTDSAYAADGHPGKNYLVAASLEEIFQHLKRLKEDECFRSNLVQQGFLAGAAFTRDATLAHWKKLVQETLPNLAVAWLQQSARKRRWFYFKQHFFYLIQRYLK